MSPFLLGVSLSFQNRFLVGPSRARMGKRPAFSYSDTASCESEAVMFCPFVPSVVILFQPENTLFGRPLAFLRFGCKHPRTRKR